MTLDIISPQGHTITVDSGTLGSYHYLRNNDPGWPAYTYRELTRGCPLAASRYYAVALAHDDTRVMALIVAGVVQDIKAKEIDIQKLTTKETVFQEVGRYHKALSSTYLEYNPEVQEAMQDLLRASKNMIDSMKRQAGSNA